MQSSIKIKEISLLQLFLDMELKKVEGSLNIILIFVKQPPKSKQIMGQCAPRKVNIKQPTKSHHLANAFKIDHFKLLRLVGRGGFSQVWKVEEKRTGKLYALKVMSKAKIIAKKSVKAALMERKILTCLMEAGAEGVSGMLASFQDHDHLYILMDYLQGHSLRHHLNYGLTLEQQQIRSIIFALLKVLEQLSQHQIIHRDIKPENILFDGQGRPFLTDFGIACFATEDGADADSGTVGYMAPEVMLAQTHSFTADYYAVGVVAFELLFGRRPFKAASKEEMLRAVNRTVVDAEHFPELKKVSAEAAGFVAGLLQKRPRLRLGHSRGISELLQHPWFTTIHADSTDTLQTNFIKSPLTNPQNIEQSPYYESQDKSVSTYMNEEVIGGLLHRDHIQEMFNSFNSQTSVEVIARRRRLSEGMKTQQVPRSLKKSATTQK